MNQRQIFVLSFFIFIVMIALQLVGIFRLFLTPILWSIILSLVFFPLYQWVLLKLKGRKNLASLLVCLIVALITVGPMVLFSGTLVREVLDFYHGLASWISEKKYEVLWQHVLQSPLRGLWDKVMQKTESLEIEIMPFIASVMQKISQAIVGQIQSGAKNFLFFVLNYCVTMVLFFFALRDGEAMGRGLKDLFPMTRENKEVVFGRLAMTVSAVVRGLVVTGVVQAFLAGMSFWILGVPYPIFLALLIAFLALVPIGGAVVVWFPSAVYLFLDGHWGKALILFLWGALIISTVDNFLKPLLIGEKTKIPTVFLFLAILGGLAFYGLIGVFLGPVMLALFMALIEIYRKEYPQEP